MIKMRDCILAQRNRFEFLSREVFEYVSEMSGGQEHRYLHARAFLSLLYEESAIAHPHPLLSISNSPFSKNILYQLNNSIWRNSEWRPFFISPKPSTPKCQQCRKELVSSLIHAHI